jgi:hypothetical protein
MSEMPMDGKDGGLTGAEYDTAWCLFWNGPTEDGNVPSKSGRDSLFDAGWLFRHDGWQSLTEKGLIGCLRLDMGRKKDKAERARGRR